MNALTELFLRPIAVLATTPTPIPAYDGDPDLITPGVVGFIAIFLIALATVFLVLDMNRRVRRTRYRAEIQERLAEERAGDELAKERAAEERAAGADPTRAPGASRD